MPKITPEIRNTAYKIYKELPANVKKGEWLSDAIEEKAAREQGKAWTPEQYIEIEELRKRIKVLEEKEERKV